MSFGRDFHGGRTYGADASDGALGIGFRVELGLAWLKARLRGFLAATALDRSAASPLRLFPPSDADERDAQQRLASMFQVFDGPGGAPPRRPRRAGRSPADTQDR